MVTICRTLRQREAIASARYLMAESILRDGRVGLSRSMEVWNAKESRLLVVPFYQAVTDLEETTVA